MPNQVSGSNCRVVMFKESSFLIPDAADAGVIVPLTSESITSTPNKQNKSTITGVRGPGKPFRGADQLDGQMTIPANRFMVGVLLAAMCGAPTTTEEAALSLTAGAAVDKGRGFVGLPVAGHGLAQDTAISVVGTVNYDGTYLVEEGTSEDEIVIFPGSYTAEVFTGDEEIHRGRVKSVSAGDAVDVGGGLVRIPCAGHDYCVGESVTLDGTTNYDGTYVLQSGTTNGVLEIEAAFVAETFDGSGLVLPKFYRHEFLLPDVQPSFTIEKYFDLDAGEGDQYDRFHGCKVNGLSFSFGGDSELTMDVQLQPADSRTAPEPLSEAPLRLPEADYGQLETALYRGGQRLGVVESCETSISLNCEGKYAVGSRGKMARVTEGDPELSGKMTCFMESSDLYDAAMNDETARHEACLFGSSGAEFRAIYPESELNPSGRVISGKGGLTQEFTVFGFVEYAESCLGFLLVDQVASY